MMESLDHNYCHKLNVLKMCSIVVHDHTYAKTEGKLIDPGRGKVSHKIPESTTQDTAPSSTIKDSRLIDRDTKAAPTVESSSTTSPSHDEVQAVPGPSSSSLPLVPYAVGTLVLCSMLEHIPTVTKILDFKLIGTPGRGKRKTYLYSLKDEVSGEIYRASHKFLSPYNPELCIKEERDMGQINYEPLPKYAKVEKPGQASKHVLRISHQGGGTNASSASLKRKRKSPGRPRLSLLLGEEKSAMQHDIDAKSNVSIKQERPEERIKPLKGKTTAVDDGAKSKIGSNGRRRGRPKRSLPTEGGNAAFVKCEAKRPRLRGPGRPKSSLKKGNLDCGIDQKQAMKAPCSKNQAPGKFKSKKFRLELTDAASKAPPLLVPENQDHEIPHRPQTTEVQEIVSPAPVPAQQPKKIHVPISEKSKHDAETLLKFLKLCKTNKENNPLKSYLR